jgi:hypothetical protein
VAAADDDDFHVSGNFNRSKYNPYEVGGHGGLNKVEALSTVMTRMWGRAADQDEPNADVIKAAAMKSLTSAQYARRNEQKSARPLPVHVTDGGTPRVN